MLEVAGPGWRLIRCADCAGEPVPAAIDDPLRTRPVIGAQLAVRIEQIRGFARDWKHAQAGEGA